MESNVILGQMIYSMANLNKRGSGLPVNLWLDENKYYIRGGHSKRIKFQMDYGNNINEEHMASMTLDGEVIWSTYSKTSELKSKDIKKVSNFVKNNQYALSHLADNEIGTFDFFQLMIQGGEPATVERIQEQIDAVNKILENS